MNGNHSGGSNIPAFKRVNTKGTAVVHRNGKFVGEKIWSGGRSFVAFGKNGKITEFELRQYSAYFPEDACMYSIIVIDDPDGHIILDSDSVPYPFDRFKPETGLTVPPYHQKVAA